MPPPSAARSGEGGYAGQSSYYSGRGAGAAKPAGQALGIQGLQKGFGGGFVGSKARTVKPIALFRAGDSVIHRSFGRGKVVEVSGEGEGQKVTVDFGERGVRTFSANIAPIIKVEE